MAVASMQVFHGAEQKSKCCSGDIMPLRLTEEEVTRLVALREGGTKLSDLDRTIKLRQLFNIHTSNPTFTRSELHEQGFPITLVRDYWDSFVLSRPEYQIKEWDDVMNVEESR